MAERVLKMSVKTVSDGRLIKYEICEICQWETPFYSTCMKLYTHLLFM